MLACHQYQMVIIRSGMQKTWLSSWGLSLMLNRWLFATLLILILATLVWTKQLKYVFPRFMCFLFCFLGFKLQVQALWLTQTLINCLAQTDQEKFPEKVKSQVRATYVVTSQYLCQILSIWIQGHWSSRWPHAAAIGEHEMAIQHQKDQEATSFCSQVTNMTSFCSQVTITMMMMKSMMVTMQIIIIIMVIKMTIMMTMHWHWHI